MPLSKMLTCFATLATLCYSNAYAFDVSLLFTNNTDKNLRPEATITYKQDGMDYWQVPTKPPQLFIPAHTKDAPADVLRTDMDLYFLEYFELFDESNKMVATCLDSYVDISKGPAILHFSLQQIGKATPHYYCDYQIEYPK